MTAGDIVQKCRWERGLSQRELSEISGFAKSTIGGIETNARDTTVTTLGILLTAMDYDLAVIDKRKK
ncbi:MAG: helix-turn-helix transcriptional regulator [Acutalibacteraceae bacterium]|nr:helix-turn-helix transcriptional regulator [Acutalibacteraceae bacterium]